MSDKETKDDARTKDSTPADAVASVAQPTQAATGPAMSSLTGEILDGNLARPVEFTDFMFKVGLHYNLPGKTETPLSVPVVAKRRRTRPWIVALAVVVSIAGGVLPMLSRPTPVTTLPPEVLGQWETTAPRYASRKLVLTADRVRIDFGDHAAAVDFPISEVRSSVTPEAVAFEVRYRQERGLTQFRFTFHESTWPPSIQLSNPEGVTWLRSEDVAAIREQARKATQVKSRGVAGVR